MARKTTESTTPRKRKTVLPAEAVSVQPAAVQVAPEAGENLQTIQASAKKSNVNLDEEIRRRAYELYLQRNGAAGDPNRDWFVAEREVRARHATVGHSA